LECKHNRREATIVQTNSKTNSIKEVQLKAVTFQQLWDSYPSGNPYHNPDYQNQCAIRVSVALHRVDIGMKSFSAKHIKPLNGQSSIGRILLDGKPTATRASELGEWLKLQPFAGLGKPENITGADWISKVKSRTGIIMFDGYWTREGEATANASGGHLDLWNGSRLTISSISGAIVTIGRSWGLNSFRQGATIVNSLSWSDLGNSKTILFWEIK
jgi:hypothetical protein